MKITSKYFTKIHCIYLIYTVCLYLCLYFYHINVCIICMSPVSLNSIIYKYILTHNYRYIIFRKIKEETFYKYDYNLYLTNTTKVKMKFSVIMLTTNFYLRLQI